MAQPAPNCNGTTFEIKKAGNGGKAIAKGSNATVHATGVVKETGKKFWSTKDEGQQPFTYQAGVGQVIKGWDQGLLGMKLGASSFLRTRALIAAAASTCCLAATCMHECAHAMQLLYHLLARVRVRRRVATGHHPGRRGLRCGRLPRVGHPAQRHARLYARGAQDRVSAHS